MDLIERDVPLRELGEAWREAAESGRFVLVCGEAGIGKTALVHQFVRQQPRQTRHFWGACDALFTPRPLGPLHDMAPHLGDDLAAQLRDGSNRPAIFAAFLQSLQQQTTLAVIEDVHWADEATLDLLKYVGRRIHLTRSMLLVTYRDDELGDQHPLRLLLGDLATSPAVHRITLEPLSASGVARLAGERHMETESLHRLTGGNPFYVTEALASGAEGVPPTVRDAVLARAARLSLSGRAVLNAAAVAGPRIEPWLLQEMTRAEASAVNESLEAGMLLAHGNVFAFRHELARIAILETIPPHQRAFLHQAVLDALHASPDGGKDLARLAHHAEGAADREAILTYARAAGKEAAALGSHRAASALYALALRHADDLPLMEQIELNEAYALSVQGDPQRKETIAAYARALELARRAGNALREGFELVRLSGNLDIVGRKEEGEERLAQALAILELRAPNRGLIDAYRLLAMQHLSRGAPQKAVEYAQKSYDMALNTEQVPVIMSAYQILGLCWLPVDNQKGIDYLEASLQMALEHKQFWAAAALYPNLIMTFIDHYRLSRAEELLREALPFAIDHDIDASAQVLEAWQAMLQMFQGHWRESTATAESILAQEAVPSLSRNPTQAALGRVLARQGELKRATKLLEEALASSLDVGSRQRQGIYYCGLAEAAWLADDHDALLEHTGAFYNVALQNRQAGFAGELAYWRWHVGETVETFDWMVRPFLLEIQGRWREAAEEWARLGCPYEQARALSHGDTEAQKAALITFEELGAKPMVERTRHKLRQAGVQTIPRGPRAATRQNPFGLTNRQLQVLDLLVEALTNAEIAERLHISPKTVDHHVSAILACLDVSSRDEAAQLARQHPDT